MSILSLDPPNGGSSTLVLLEDKNNGVPTPTKRVTPKCTTCSPQAPPPRIARGFQSGISMMSFSSRSAYGPGKDMRAVGFRARFGLVLA